MKNSQKGFTLTEVIISIALIGIIALGIIPTFANQLKMTVSTRKLTSKYFDSQGEFERAVYEVKSTLSQKGDPPSMENVDKVEFKNVFSNRKADLYKTTMKFPENDKKVFTLYMSKKLAEMEQHQLLVAEEVTIEISGETIHQVANLSKSPPPILHGRVKKNENKNWYANKYAWYVSREGNPNPEFPSDYERIIFSGETPNKLENLGRFSNRYIIFTVIPVDIHGARGSEVSSDRVYILGKEWRASMLAWIDKNLDSTYNDGDIELQKDILEKPFDGAIRFQDPKKPENTLDPKNGALFVPMGIDKSSTQQFGPPFKDQSGKDLDWQVDKTIHLSADLWADNNSIKLKAREGDIILYQYVKINQTGVETDSDGRSKLIDRGPELKAPQGEIILETEKQGTAVLQGFASLQAGQDLSIRPHGPVNINQSNLESSKNISIDTSKGALIPGNRDIIIKSSTVKLLASSHTDRSININSRDKINIKDTGFTGLLDQSKMSLSGSSIDVEGVNFHNLSLDLNNHTSIKDSQWNGPVKVAEGKTLKLKGEIQNQGSLDLGDSAKAELSPSMTHALKLNLTKESANTVGLSTENYYRNIRYADSFTEPVPISADARPLGKNQTNLSYRITQDSGGASPDISIGFDKERALISIHAAGPTQDDYISYYTLTVEDRYTKKDNGESLSGSIKFRISVAGGSNPLVEILGPVLPEYSVNFYKNEGSPSENPLESKSIPAGQAIGTLPEVLRQGFNLLGWNTSADGSGTAITADTIVHQNMKIYAQWTQQTMVEIKFYAGNTLVDTLFVEKGQSVGAVPVPEKNQIPRGHIFDKWVERGSNPELEINSNTVANRDMIAEAKWIKKKQFSDIEIGEYISIDKEAYQKVSADKILLRGKIGEPMRWSDRNTTILGADSLARTYADNLKKEFSWIKSSGLLDGQSLTSLQSHSEAILVMGYGWWGGSSSNNRAYYIRNDGSSATANKNNSSNNYYLRPYLLVDGEGLYVDAGSGKSGDPYELLVEK